MGVVDLLEAVEVEQHQRQRPVMALGARELARQLLVELALVERLGEPVAHDHLVDRLVVGVLDVLLVQELEVHRPDLEAVAAAQQRRSVHPLVVHEGAVRRTGVLDRDLAPLIAQPGVTARDRAHFGETDVDVVGAADLERRAGDQAVARAETGVLRMGDQDDVGLERRAPGRLFLGVAVGEGDRSGSLPIVQLLQPEAVGGGLPLSGAASLWRERTTGRPARANDYPAGFRQRRPPAATTRERKRRRRVADSGLGRRACSRLSIAPWSERYSSR